MTGTETGFEKEAKGTGTCTCNSKMAFIKEIKNFILMHC